MSVHLDWEVESEAGHSQIDEDPRVVAARRQRARRLRRGLLIGALVVTAGALAAGWRLRQVDQARQAMLTATVESEALALRIGSEHQLMQRQSRDQSWRTEQKTSFDQYQAASHRITLTGEIVEMEIEGSSAAVTTIAEVDGRQTEIRWYYEYLDQGWRHTNSDPEPWDVVIEQGDSGAWFTYRRLDAPVMQTFDALLARWWGEAQPLTGLDAPQLQVQLEPNAPHLASWYHHTLGILHLPSETDTGTPLRAPSDETQQAIIALLAEFWAIRALDGRLLQRADAWASEEVRLALAHQMEPTSEPARVLGPFIDLFGPEFVRVYASHLRRGERPGSALAETIHAAYHAHGGRLAPEAYFRALLIGQVACRRDYSLCPDKAIFWAADAPDSGRNSDVALFTVSQLESARLDTLEVVDIEPLGDVAWVQVRYQSIYDTPGAATGRLAAFIVFRRVNDQWALDAPRRSYFGQGIEERSEHVMLFYSEVDAPFATDLLAYSEAAYQQLVGDFGIREPQPAAIILDPGIERADPAAAETTPDADQITLWLASPRINCCGAGITPPMALRFEIADGLVRRLMEATGPLEEAPSVVNDAVLSWELERLGTDHPFLNNRPAPSVPADPASLADAWESVGPDGGPEEYALGRLAVMALLDALVEQYGIEALPPLLAHLDLSRDLGAWLDASVGITASEIEPAWQARFTARLGQP